MRLIHYSKSFEFSLDPEMIPGGSDEPGIFVYPVGAHLPWTNRIEHLLSVPDECVEEVQRFAPGEAGNEIEIVELFIPARHFNRVTVY